MTHALMLISEALTHRGRVRPDNEDALLARDDAGLWAVADGMGGHEGGAQASAGVVKALAGLSMDATIDEALESLCEGIQQANRNLIAQTANSPRRRKPGTTIVAALVRDGEGAAVWAGDSRLYRYRDGSLERLTKDHSQVQKLIDEGVLDELAAEEHPMAHVITRAIGFDDPVPLETRRFTVQAGDRLLLCSDGLTRTVSDTEIRESITRLAPGIRARGLVELALQRGAPDNVSVICVDCDG
jgi:serine/threonine-protein phosphatase Stp1